MVKFSIQVILTNIMLCIVSLQKWDIAKVTPKITTVNVE